MSRDEHRPYVMPLVVGGTAILLLAANLRISVNVVGAVLPEMRETLGMSGFATGALAALPMFCFAFLGPIAPSLARRIGLSRTALAAALVLTIGQLVRAVLPGLGWIFAGSVIAMTALAFINVIMPSLVRQYFPDKIAAWTTAYTLLLGVFSASASAVTLPLQAWLGGDYRFGLGMWAGMTALAFVAWLPALRTDPEPLREGETMLRLATLARTPKAWWIVLLFAAQALQAYVTFALYPTLLSDGGMSRPAAAAAQMAIVAAMSGIATIGMPWAINRLRTPTLVAWFLISCYVVGYVGLLVAPTPLTTLWSFLLGIGQSFFPVCLYIVNIRARTHAGVLALSAFMQSLGYLFAGIALVLIGVIHGSSTDWTWVLILRLVVCAIQMTAALVGFGRWHIEDHLASDHRPRHLARRGSRRTTRP